MSDMVACDVFLLGVAFYHDLLTKSLVSDSHEVRSFITRV